MRRRVVFLSGAAIAALFAQPVGAQESPPRGWMIISQDSVRLTEMHHCWYALDASEPITICADTFMPPDSAYGEEWSVGPRELMELRFEVDPQEIWVTLEKVGSGEEIEIPGESTLEAPKEPGHYFFRIGARWPRGSVTSMLRVRVVEEAEWEVSAAVFVAEPTSPAACSSGPDSDRDGLSDQCELSLATRFAPALVVSTGACNWVPEAERLGGAYFFGARPTVDGIRLVYLPAYFMDCGWSGPKCLLRWRGGCDPHDGDSEFIAVDVVPRVRGQGWELERVFLSAHCFGDSEGDCRWFAAPEFERFGDAVLVWVAEGKNANYRTKSACDSGHWHFDTCDRNDVTVRYPIESVLQNIGSSEVPFPHYQSGRGCLSAAELPSVAGRPGTECLWTDERFHGWAERVGEGSTGYRRYLETVSEFIVAR